MRTDDPVLLGPEPFAEFTRLRELVRPLAPPGAKLPPGTNFGPLAGRAQIQPHGRLHPDCLPADLPPPCATCERLGLTRPDEPILDAASLPTNLDLFRVGNFATMVIGTERFMEAVRRMERPGIVFRELPTR